MFHNRNVKYHLCVSLLLIVPVMVFAGAPPTPGAVKETLPKQKRLPPEAMPEEIESPQPVLPKVPAGGPKIPVKQFEITGNSALPTDELLGVIEIYKGRELTLLEIYSVADILTRYYRDKGFPLATVTVPPQQVSSGVIRFEVIEGRIGALLFEGNESYSSEFLMRHVDELVIGEILALR